MPRWPVPHTPPPPATPLFTPVACARLRGDGDACGCTRLDALVWAVVWLDQVERHHPAMWLLFCEARLAYAERAKALDVERPRVHPGARPV